MFQGFQRGTGDADARWRSVPLSPRIVSIAGTGTGVGANQRPCKAPRGDGGAPPAAQPALPLHIN